MANPKEPEVVVRLDGETYGLTRERRFGDGQDSADGDTDVADPVRVHQQQRSDFGESTWQRHDNPGPLLPGLCNALVRETIKARRAS